MKLVFHCTGETYIKEMESGDLRQMQYIKMRTPRYQVCTYFCILTFGFVTFWKLYIIIVNSVLLG